MFVSWKVKSFWITILYSLSVCSTQDCEQKIIGEMIKSSLKNKSRSYFLEEIFWPADSKSLILRIAAFEMLLIHGVWCSAFKHHPTSRAKTVSSFLREVQKQYFTSCRITKRGKANNYLCQLLYREFLCKQKKVCQRESLSFQGCCIVHK